jgi:hypothetical protein
MIGLQRLLLRRYEDERDSDDLRSSIIRAMAKLLVSCNAATAMVVLRRAILPDRAALGVVVSTLAPGKDGKHAGIFFLYAVSRLPRATVRRRSVTRHI